MVNLMTQCETCGCPLEASYLYRVCPGCLLREAIRPGASPLPPSAASSPAEPAGRGPRFSTATDFFTKYELLEQVGQGGQGDIWKVWDFEFRRHVAMKRLGKGLLASEPARYRFLAEAQISSQLEHPGVLPVFDVGLDPDGRPFYTTQLLPGTTFGDICRQAHDSGRPDWPLRRAVELLLPVCDVMALAHSRGVIHRDLKPSNILVGAFGDVRVIDWGSAHVLEVSRPNIQEPLVPVNREVVQTDRGEFLWAEPGSPLSTGRSGLPITVLFTPPEILRGEVACLGPRTDIYSLGVVLYGLLAGRLPYVLSGEDLPPPAQLREFILSGPPSPVRSLDASVSRDLAAICAKAMAHEFSDRYRSMSELAADLKAALEIRPVQARRPGPWMILQKWALRNISYVLIGGFSLVFISALLSFAHGFKAERDAARQFQELRSAELAARSGHWREALRDWDIAEADGCPDTIYLNLHRAEAWTILNEPARSGVLLKRLAARADLGGQRGAVLLRLGEHELFDHATASQGAQHVRDALAAGLDEADRQFAEGLLADSTPVALDRFHAALRYDPYHHGAHRHSLSLEFMLGQRAELASHIKVFRILYPDDPSPGFILAVEAAMAGDLPGAQAELARLRGQTSSNAWEQADQTYHAYAAAAAFYDVDALLQADPPRRTPLDQLRNDPFSAGTLLLPGNFTGQTNLAAIRIPSLPCLQLGILAAGDGIQRLLMPFLSDPAVAVKEIEAGWQHHPEALMPVLGGMVLEKQQPAGAPPLPEILKMQARLYQMGADSPAMMPTIARLARYLACRTELELRAASPPDAGTARTNCLTNLRLAATRPETSVAEAHAYCGFALRLGEPDLARAFALLGEARQPAALMVRRDRIEVELAAGAAGPALERIRQLLAENPRDPWALDRLNAVRSALQVQLNSSASAPSESTNHP